MTGQSTKSWPFYLFLIAACVFQLTAAAIIGLDGPPSHDEGAFLRNIKYFGGSVSIEKLRDYPEIKGPLMFIVYGKFGDLFGFELWKLRALSVAISILTLWVYYLLLWRVFGSHRIAALTCGLLMVNPYWIRLSVFVYVDMMPLLFMALYLLLLLRNQIVLPLLLLAGTLLCTQHYVFAPLGAGLFWAARMLRGASAATGRGDRVRSAGMIIGYALCLVPFGLLALLWQGVAPPGAVAGLPWNESLYHPQHLTVYVLLLPVFVAPILLLRLKPIYFSWRTIVLACLLSPYYYFFPVRLSRWAEGRTPAIGIFHRLVQVVTNENRLLEHAVLCLAFVAGIPILLYLMKDCCQKVKGRQFDLALLLDLMILSFLLVMPFSPALWEKYFMPLVPLLSIRLLLIGRNGGEAGPFARVPQAAG